MTDAQNRFVLGLRKEDFRVLDDGVEQPIAHFSGDDVPLSVGLAFDASGSMDFKLKTSLDAAALFLKTLNPGDEAFLVKFSDKVELAVPFTVRPQDISSALQDIQPGGLTALLDAIKFAVSEMKTAKNSRKAIVIVSDGGDNHSTYTPAQIEELVRRPTSRSTPWECSIPCCLWRSRPRRSRTALAVRDRQPDRRAGVCGGHGDRSTQRGGEDRDRA